MNSCKKQRNIATEKGIRDPWRKMRMGARNEGLRPTAVAIPHANSIAAHRFGHGWTG